MRQRKYRKFGLAVPKEVIARPWYDSPTMHNPRYDVRYVRVNPRRNTLYQSPGIVITPDELMREELFGVNDLGSYTEYVKTKKEMEMDQKRKQFEKQVETAKAVLIAQEQQKQQQREQRRQRGRGLERDLPVEPVQPDEEEVVVDRVIQGIQGIKNLAQVGVSAYGSPEANLIRNSWGTIANNNPKWRSGFPGEYHLLNSRGVSYNWLGPGTNVKARIARGDEGLDALDECAKQHDIAYMNAKSYSDVKRADNMLRQCAKEKGGNIGKLVNTMIAAKQIGQDLGFIEKNKFITHAIEGSGLKKKKKKDDPLRKLRARVRKSAVRDKKAVKTTMKTVKAPKRKKPSKKLLRLASQLIKNSL